VDPWPTTTTADPFDRAQRQLLVEERALRALAEGQAREFRRLVVEFASTFVAEELDARRRADPRFAERATPADWRTLLHLARQEESAAVRWPATPRLAELPAVAEAARWQAEAERLAGEVARLIAELALAQAIRPVESALAQEGSDPQDRAPQEADRQGRVSEPPAPASLLPAPMKPGAAPKAAPAVNPLGLADVRLPALPPIAPARFADQLQAWPREALALAILGVTGWSMRLAVADQMSAALGSVKASAGSLRRTYSVLAKRGFWIEHKVTLAGVHTPIPETDGAEGEAAPSGGPAEATILVLVRLGDLGRDLLRACGIQPVLSEWELLAAAHGSQATSNFAGLICAFTYHARLRGYATALTAPVDSSAPGVQGGQAGPMVLVRKGDETLQVAVAGHGDDGELWQARAAQRDRAAFVTLTPELRDRLGAQAQAAGAEHGLATDLQTLFNTQEARGPLWAVQW